MVNVVVLGGNLCFAPDLKYTPQGTAVCSLRLASNSKYTTKGGEKREKVLFIDVQAWGKTAENCAEYLEKGSKVLVQGELHLNEWDDRKTGQKHSKIVVYAQSVQFLSSKHANGAAEPVGVGAGFERNDVNDLSVPF